MILILMYTIILRVLIIMSKRILYIINDLDFFISHRLPVAQAASKKGFDIHIASGSSEWVNKINSFKFEYYLIPLSRSGTDIFKEIILFIKIIILLFKIKPFILHLVTIKPILYGGIASRICRIPNVVYAISGLGTVFLPTTSKQKILKFFVLFLYKLALNRPGKFVIFQNKNDMFTLRKVANISRSEEVLIKGSGVSLSKFRYTPESVGIPTVTIACRLLRDKGVGEFVKAVKILNNKGINAEYWIVGDIDKGNPRSFTEYDLACWRKIKNIRVLGYSKDIFDIYSRSNIICLPSYREGFPKSLIEAAACGRAIVTTDVPGCSDAVIPGETGLLVAPRNPFHLAETIEKLVVNHEDRIKMGHAGRILAEKEYDIRSVVDKHINIYLNFIE